jgi:hypothetical protein
MSAFVHILTVANCQTNRTGFSTLPNKMSIHEARLLAAPVLAAGVNPDFVKQKSQRLSAHGWGLSANFGMPVLLCIKRSC